MSYPARAEGLVNRIINKVEYYLSNKEIQKVNEECDLELIVDDTFETDNYILSIVSRANKMIGWVVRNLISREANVVFKIHKTLIRHHIKYCTQAWTLESRYEMEGIQRTVTKRIKKNNRLQLKGETGEIKINKFSRKKNER